MSRVLGGLLAVLSFAAAAAFLRLALAHLRYPGELDYIEGVILDHVVRLLEGKPLYVAPTASYIPLAYMPGYPFFVSLLAKAIGPSFFAGRVISLLASLGIAALVGVIVRRETGRWTYAVVGPGLYFMGYGLAGGGHYDVARPDSLMLFLSLLAFAMLRFTQRAPGAIAAALLLAVAFFTKQHAVWFGLAALAHVALNDRRRRVPFALPWLAGCAGGYALLSAWLGPWFSYFTWDLPSHWSTIAPVRIERYIGGGLLGMLGPLTLASLASLALPEAPWRGRSGLWAWLGLAGFGTGMLATLDPSAWRHVFIPSMMALSVLGPISFHRLASWLESSSPAVRERVRSVSFALLALQFVPLIYPLHNEAPHAGAREARAALLDTLRAIPGPVIVLEHGFYTWQAGKGTGLQEIAFGDLARSRGDRLEPADLRRLLDPLRRGAGRPVLITDEPLEQVDSLWAYVAPGYRLERDLGGRFEPLRGFAGHALWPRLVYLPFVPDAPVDSSPAPGAVPAP